MSKKFSFTRSLLTVFMALILTFTLIACGNNNQELADEAADSVAIIFASGDNANSVTQNLNLPTTVGDVAITWSSNNTSVIANNGTVTRGFNDVTVILTATATVGDATATKQFTLIVKGHDVQAALNAINITGALTYNATTQIYTVNGNITLPTTANGLAVTWESTIPAVISATGVVVRPAYGQPNANVTLIASINNVEREFNMVVPAITEKPASLILQEASDALLLSGVSDGVSANLSLPSVVGTEGVTVTWSSSNTAVISNTGVVVRGENNVTIILTATLTLGTASVTKEFEVVVLAATSYVVVSNIAEAIEIAQNPVTGNVVNTYVQINNVTVLGITGDGLVIMDESGYLFMYIPTASNKVTQTGEPVVKNGVYTVRGIATRFNNTWQLSFSASEPIMFFASEEAPYVPTPIVAENVSAMLANHVVPSTENPNFVMQYYRLTAKVRVQNPTDNYGIVFVNPDYTGPDIPTAANSAHTVDGVVVYYHSNKAAFNNLHDQVVTFNLIMYGYRNDRYVFYSLFLGTIDDIQTSLDDQGTVNLVESTLVGQTPKEFSQAGTVALPTSLLGATIAWTSSNETLINSTTGAVTLPAEGQVEVTLTATITKGEASKVVTIKVNVGELQPIPISEARSKANNTIVMVEGLITSIAFDASDRAVLFMEDSSAGIYVYKVPASFKSSLVVGNVVRIIGARSEFGASPQIVNITAVTVVETAQTVTPLVITDPAQLVDNQGKHVSVTGYLRQDYTGTPSDFHLVTAAGTYNLRLVSGSDQIAATRDAVQALLVAAAVGAEVTVIGGAQRNNAVYQVMLFQANLVTVGAVGSEADLGAIAAASFVKPVDNPALIANVTLPTAGAFGSVITWTSSDPAVITNAGVVTRPAFEDGDATVVLTYSLKIGDTEYGTGTVEYTVLKAEKIVVEYALPEYRAFVNNWEGSAATLIGRDGELVLTATALNAVNESWKVQVIQDATAISGAADNTGHMQLVAGKSYRVMFDAYASVAGEIKLAIGHSTNWVSYFEQAGIAVTTEKQTFTIDFTLSAEGNYTTLAQFKLELGTLFAGKTAPQWFALDNVVIKELVGEAYVATNLILNGTMDAPVEVIEPVTVIASFTGLANGNFAASPANNAELINLDAALFTATSLLGSASAEVGLNTAGQIRIYGHRQSGNGNTLTISIAEGFKITAVEFVFVGSTNGPSATLMLGTQEVLLVTADLLNVTKTYTDLDISMFSLKNTQVSDGSSNAQIWISQIKITYEVDQPDVEPEGTLMIFELYGAGGNSGAAWNNDYVVLYNGTNSAIDLSGYSLHYASATGNFGTTNNINLTGTIASKGFFFIRLAAGTTVTDKPLPVTPDLSSTIINMAGAAGKLALATGPAETALTGAADARIVDFVGFGTTANLFEGTGPAPAPSTVNSIKRVSFVDTNDNATDFAAGPTDFSYLTP